MIRSYQFFSYSVTAMHVTISTKTAVAVLTKMAISSKSLVFLNVLFGALLTILPILSQAVMRSQNYENSSIRNFTVDYNKGVFMKDGEPFNYVSGSIHYFRLHPDMWYDRLYKMRFAGLNAIQLYIAWNYHEEQQGRYNFNGSRDVERFIEIADDLGFLVILRPGPYICAEWEFGGFPYWVIKENATVALRTSNPVYLKWVTNWFTVLFGRLERLLYKNGGPIITVQIENEYGSFSACDHNYTYYLLSLSQRLLGNDVVFFTTDGDGTNYLKCGAINNTLTTVDFGAGSASRGFSVLNQWNFWFAGPYVNSEYYIGWLDQWGSKHSVVNAAAAAATLDEILKMGANVNMYMFYGGTNFGFSSGAPGDNPFRPVPTSYDYDAAVSEAGDLTYKYYLLRYTIQKYKKIPVMDPPYNTTKAAFGTVNVTLQAPLHHCAPIVAKLANKQIYTNVYPLRMELLDAPYGYILYQHDIQMDIQQGNISIVGIRDRGYVILNDEYVGILYRDGPTEIAVEAKKGDRLHIIVENMGRVNYGSGILRGTKGIISNVTINGRIATGWTMISVHTDLDLLDKCKAILGESAHTLYKTFVPSTFVGNFYVEKAADTFLRLDGWYKGHVEINGFNIGRYWPIKGPQITLYVPSAILKHGNNSILVTELEHALCTAVDTPCQVEFVDAPVLNGNVTQDSTYVWTRKDLH